MSGSGNRSLTSRRSTRVSIPTDRAEQFIESTSQFDPRYPSEGDEILVKWILNDGSIWWPASVLSLERVLPHQTSRVGDLQYHKFRNYNAERAKVIFSFNPANEERLVTSYLGTFHSTRKRGGSEDKQSSWIYKSEHERTTSKTVYKSLCNRHAATPVPRSDPRLPNVSMKRQSARTSKRLAKTEAALLQANQTPTSPVHTSSHLQQNQFDVAQSQTLDGNTALNQLGDSLTIDTPRPGLDSTIVKQEDTKEKERRLPKDTSSPRMEIIETRLSLLERKLVRSSASSDGSLSIPTTSVLTCLRWAFLKSLEKPLKEENSAELIMHGVARKTVEVKTSCDYLSFKELSAYLSVSKYYNANQKHNSRLAFSPAFHITQAGSSAADDMSILFSTLADITSVLRIRDDRDYESILSTEVKTRESTMFRFLGSYVIHSDDIAGEEGFEQAQHSSNTDLSSTKYSKSLRLFIGSSPVRFRPIRDVEVSKKKEETSEKHTDFRSVVIEQNCTNFCATQRCFLSPWVAQYVQSDFNLDCAFDEDGTVPCAHVSNYFCLRWNRLQAPSTTRGRWTKDVVDVGNNMPGTLTLSVPTVLMCASRNVNSIISMMDTFIENYMDIRSKIHPN